MMRLDTAARRYLSIALTALATTAAAQEPPREAEARDVETYIPPKPLTRTNPAYPTAALMAGREGWATLSFVVSRDGEVTEAMIEESSGDEQLEQAALDAVMKWRYEPARLNGEPVEQAMTEVDLVFMLDGPDSNGARTSFRRRFREIVELLQAGDAATAAAGIDELESEGRFNLYEDAWFWYLKAYQLEVTKSPDVDARIRALERAVRTQVYLDATTQVYLEPPFHVTASRQLYVLHAKAGNFREAIETFEALRDEKLVKSADNYEATLAAMRPSYDQMLQAVHGRNLLVRQAKIGEHDYWVGKLLRRSFTLLDVVGRIDVVDIRCNLGTGRYAFTNPEQVWIVPENWRDCGVYIKGEPGATFAFQEYPLGYAPGDGAAVSQPSVSP
jgi:protein TonB